ncbi:APC family permease [Leucobacter sp. UT-8R-CII-1-4]|uniref:APC family permease n=1 Tax=Leucobacter sp. UT-8R-CII-1-4 TaxID=3040075 RepID=UPI0024A99099|nr:APC family permease [Leucobacter sp. UT-8R-CII-1-4]MDI6022166.1 APC family permease [Leucobacter sp. UT-8R-CII-1-4]
MNAQATAEQRSVAPGTARLVPQLSLSGLIIFGVSYMAPAIVIATFGVIATLANGATVLAYLVATLAMLLSAMSYGKLAKAYPSSGSIYTYARGTLGSHTGFLAGWVILLDYLFLPMVAWLIMGLYVSAQFPFLPSWAWGIGFIVITTAVNIVGVKFADRLNRVLLVIVGAAVVAVVIFGTVFAAKQGHPVGPAVFPAELALPAVVAGAAVAAYSFLGFDAVTTLTEEVKDAKRNVPRAIVSVVLIGGGIFVLVAFVMQWAHPGLDFESADTAGFEVLGAIGGPVFAGIVNAAILIGTLASCFAVQASGSRLLFVMGRDGVLPKRIFGRLSQKFRTPVVSLLIIAAIGVAGQLLTMGDATSLINFGAFLAFATANVCVIVLWRKNPNRQRTPGAIIGWIVLPVLACAVDIFLLISLSPLAIGIGTAWIALGVLMLAILTRGFRRPVPRLDIGAAEAASAAVSENTELNRVPGSH